MKEIITNSTLSLIKREIKENFCAYEKFYNGEFTTKDLMNKLKEYLGKEFKFYDTQDLNIEYPMDLSSGKEYADAINNSKKIYEALGKDSFPLHYAMDEAYWVTLAHIEYGDFYQKRWPMDGDEKSNLNRVLNRYFFGMQPKRRHELARYWWVPYLTYDETLEDPYELTKIAFEYADPSSAILERNYGKNKDVTKAAMLAIKNNVENENIKNRKFYSKFAKEVNSIASTIVLDFLSKEELGRCLLKN